MAMSMDRQTDAAEARRRAGGRPTSDAAEERGEAGAGAGAGAAAAAAAAVVAAVAAASCASHAASAEGSRGGYAAGRGSASEPAENATTSGAIHLANYYRDQLAETGVQEGAAGRAVHHALLPLSLATGTTAIGLATLAVSELVPIRMFGIFSAAGVLVSFIILVTFMPAALELFPPKLRVGKLADDEQVDGWKPIESSRW
jgi:hypothetical protein